MRRLASLPCAGVACVLVVLLSGAHRGAAQSAGLPASLTDQAFWKLTSDWSEPGGYFRNADITNLTSNEMLYEHVLTDLASRAKQGGVYLGVGPEQNYTYIAALHPKMVIIFDIRRGNLDLQLMYKAIFELSPDRAAFVSMLFSKAPPKEVSRDVSVGELFNVVGAAPASAAQHASYWHLIETQLTQKHAFPLDARDLDGVRQIYDLFYQSGFALRASPTYADLMTATDEHGVARSFLASHASYAVLRALEEQNLVLPVVGDFSGPKALRAAGAWLKGTGATVSAFYLSNVEQYLVDGKWDTFCRSVATFPLDTASTFIRSASGGGGFGGGFRGPGFVSSLGSMADETRACGRTGASVSWAK